MKLLLRALLIRRARDEGFVLPVVIALGLIMILLGVVNIVRSSEENLTAISQNSRTDAFAIAELGIARYREFLDRNRTLALSNLANWTAQAEVCDFTTGTGGWADSTSTTWRDITLDEIALGQDLNGNGDALDTNQTQTIGEYKIVNYIYNGNTPFNQTDDSLNGDSTGTLTVKGRTTNGSEAQIQAEIPIRINKQDMDNLAPALWISDSSVTASDLGNLTIGGGGNIVVSDPAVRTTGSEANRCRNFATLTGAGFPAISDPRTVPPITNLVSLIAAATGGTINTLADDDTTEIGINISNDTIAGSIGDNQHGDGRYYYEVDNSNTFVISNNVDLETDGVSKVTLYVDNNVDIGENVDINRNNISSAYLEIYVNGDRTINIDTGTSGTTNITAFIHAPNSKLDIKGNGTLNIVGSVWIEEFENVEGATVKITPDNTYDGGSEGFDKSYEFYTTTKDRTPKPLTASPSDWRTEEVN